MVDPIAGIIMYGRLFVNNLGAWIAAGRFSNAYNVDQYH